MNEKLLTIITNTRFKNTVFSLFYLFFFVEKNDSILNRYIKLQIYYIYLIYGLNKIQLKNQIILS